MKTSVEEFPKTFSSGRYHCSRVLWAFSSGRRHYSRVLWAIFSISFQICIPPHCVVLVVAARMEITGTEVPEMLLGDLVLDEHALEKTEKILHFFTPETHELVNNVIRRSLAGPKATETDFICSSDVLYTQISDDPLIDLTGKIVASVHFTTQLDFSVHPIGSPEAIRLNPEDVKLVILFGSKSWNEGVGDRYVENGIRTPLLQQLMDDQEDLLRQLRNVPVIGGKPTHEELSIARRGFLVTGKKFSVHSKLLENSQNAGQVFHELHEEVDQAAAKFGRPKFIGFIFGAFGSLLRNKAHYMDGSAWSKLQNEFPRVQFTGFSTTSIYSGDYPFTANLNKTSVTIIIMEHY